MKNFIFCAVFILVMLKNYNNALNLVFDFRHGHDCQAWCVPKNRFTQIFDKNVFKYFCKFLYFL